ncbi:MAG: trimethylamine methyltransferase family protein [Anaerovoracaceae bacterium]|jgi:trimethylamine--corrinoid protein Co-methyltransferase
MKMMGSVLNDEEIKEIHRQSIYILENVGVKVPSEKALGMLEASGAKIDWDKQIVFIPENLVQKCLASAPKEFTLGARNPEYDFPMPSSYSVMNLDGTGVNVLDHRTGKRRPAALQDVSDAARVFEEIEIGKVLWSPVIPYDVPSGASGVLNTATSLMNCSKHVQDEAKNIREVPYLIEIVKAITGSVEELISRKIYSVTYCTVAPLCHDPEMLEATMELTKYQVPVLIYPMPACGSTGPASLASNIALANAEALSAMVIFQLASPGTPVIYGAALGIIDRRSGVFLEGAVETVLQLTAMNQVGKYYGFPTIIAGCLSDALETGMQAVMEKVLTTLPLVLNRVDVVQGIGLIESSMTLSLEQMLIDAEIGQLCNRMQAGIHMAPEKNLYEDIKTVGQGGHYLKQKSTRALFRSGEYFTPVLSERSTYDAWMEMGSPSMFSKAHEKVENILAAEMRNPLDSQTQKVIEEIMEEAKAKL